MTDMDSNLESGRVVGFDTLGMVNYKSCTSIYGFKCAQILRSTVHNMVRFMTSVRGYRTYIAI